MEEALDAPRERGRRTAPARAHGPGESLITSGDGSGVMSPSALRAGEESAEPGDKEPAMLPADSVLLRRPSWMAIGAVAECRNSSFVWPSRLSEKWCGGCESSVGVKAEISVCTWRPAAEGWRRWARKGEMARLEEMSTSESSRGWVDDGSCSDRFERREEVFASTECAVVELELELGSTNADVDVVVCVPVPVLVPVSVSV